MARQKAPSPNADMTLSEYGRCCIKLWEEDSLEPKLEAYDDGTGTWTIAWGNTKGVYRGMRITREQAEKMFDEHIEPYIQAVRDRIKVPLKQRQFDAMTSFFYNVGTAAGDSIVAAINRNEMDKVPGFFMLYVKARQGKNGPLVTWPGLVNRRSKEVALWEGRYSDPRIPGNKPPIKPLKEQPPAEEPNKPMAVAAMQSKSFWALINAKVLVFISMFTGLLGEGFNWIMGLFDLFPAITNDAGQAISSAQQVAEWLGIDWTKIGVGMVIALCAVAAYRHLNDKRVTA